MATVRPSTVTVAAGVAWAGFVAWCVAGIPPAVDLPAHAAQMETLGQLLGHHPDVAATYRATFPLGYGLTTWLALPLTLAVHGAFAAKATLWLSLTLFPLGVVALARALGHGAPLVLGVPAAALAFNLSYWFGFLPTVAALPAVLFFWAVLVRASQHDRLRAPHVLALTALATAVMLAHFVMFAPLVVGGAAVALAAQKRRQTLGLLALALAPSVVLSAARVWTLAGRARGPGAQAFEWDGGGHLNWLFKTSTIWGQLDVGLSWALGLAAIATWLFVPRARGPRTAGALAVALGALYLATPKALSGAWLLYPRLAVLLVVGALLLVDVSRLRAAAWLFVGVGLASLGLTAHRHALFAAETRGLVELLETPPPPNVVHGGLSLVGLQTPSTRLKVLEHLAQWWTARWGGVGHHFFADADHQPVRFVEGVELPGLLEPTDPPVRFAPFGALLVFGDEPLPPGLGGFVEVDRAGAWRRLERAR